jgi:hypothetical protein
MRNGDEGLSPAILNEKNQFSKCLVLKIIESHTVILVKLTSWSSNWHIYYYIQHFDYQFTKYKLIPNIVNTANFHKVLQIQALFPMIEK